MSDETEAVEFRMSGGAGLPSRSKKNSRAKKKKRGRERGKESERESESATLSLSMIQRAGISFLWGIFFGSGNQWSLSRSEGSALHWLSLSQGPLLPLSLPTSFCLFTVLIGAYKRSCMRSVLGRQNFI